MVDWQTVTLDALPKIASLSGAGMLVAQEPEGPLATTTQAALLAAASAAGALAGGGVSSIDLFTNLATYALPAGMTAFITGGYSSAGIGGGTYVADLLATSALASACPRFCQADSTGRYWRMAPVNGIIAISQAGALGAAHNDQPAVQAAIDYARTTGARTLLWDFDTVSLWCPLRTSSASDGGQIAFNTDGQSIVVSAPIKFQGLGSWTHIKLLAHDGTSLETGWQNIGGYVWRGSGINLMGGPNGDAPSEYGLTCFEMDRIWLDGGCAYTGVRTPVTPSSPDGPDLTNKGIRLQDTQCDKIVLTNCIISGFKGEAAYFAGRTQTRQILKNTLIFGSNQSAFNPSTGTVEADNCKFGDSFIAMECLGGVGGRFINVTFYKSKQMSVLGGMSNGFSPWNFGYPTRLLTESPPWIDLIDCDFDTIGQFLGGNYLRIIRGRMTDSTLYLVAGTNGFGGVGSFTSTYIDLDYTVDQNGQSPICVVGGPLTLTDLIPGAPAGNYIAPPSDIHIKLNIHRTQHAIANNYLAVAYSLYGYFDQNSCSFSIGDADGVSQHTNPGQYGAVFSQPLISFDGPSSAQMSYGQLFGAYRVTITAGPYALTVSNPRLALAYAGTATAIAVTMAAPFSAPYGYANGQKARIYWAGGTTAGTTFTFARNGSGLRLNSDCTLAVFGDWIEVEFNAITGLWHETARSIYAA